MNDITQNNDAVFDYRDNEVESIELNFVVSEAVRPFGANELEERTIEFAFGAIELYRLLHRGEPAARHRSGQYLSAAASIGANVAEAQAAESRADFAHKMSIAKKEARETLYWLRLFRRANLAPAPVLDSRIDEACQLLAILSAIVKKTKPR